MAHTILSRLLLPAALLVGACGCGAQGHSARVPAPVPVPPAGVFQVASHPMDSGGRSFRGYVVGQSIVYPLGGGTFALAANPGIRWTAAAKNRYLRQHQAQRDLRTFKRAVAGGG